MSDMDAIDDDPGTGDELAANTWLLDRWARQKTMTPSEVKETFGLGHGVFEARVFIMMRKHRSGQMEKWRRCLLTSASATFVALLISASTLHAECVQRNAKMLMSHALVFSGTVIEANASGPEGARLTFEVDSVWKGSVTRRFDIYAWYRQPEAPHLELGKRHLVIADPLVDPQVRQYVGLDRKEMVAYSPASCTDPASLVPGIEVDLGAGAPPK
jgi:hypothetical protein